MANTHYVFNPTALSGGSFFVEIEGLAELQQDLGLLKDKSKYIVRGALNETAKDVKKMLVDECAKAYRLDNKIRKSHVEKTLDISKATVGYLEAWVVSEGTVNELYDFTVSPRAYYPSSVHGTTPKSGRRAGIKRSNGLTNIRLSGNHDAYKAFVVQYGSGHQTIVQRIPGSMHEVSVKSKKTGKIGTQHRESIKNLYTSSIPKMLEGKDVYGIVEPQIEDIILTHAQNYINKILSKEI